MGGCTAPTTARRVVAILGHVPRRNIADRWRVTLDFSNLKDEFGNTVTTTNVRKLPLDVVRRLTVQATRA